MDIKRLRIFQKVYQLGSITGAAKALNYSQSAVSEAIKGLEVDLSQPLFERLGRGIFPSPLAHQIIDEVDEILEKFDQLALRCHTNNREYLRIGITESLALYRFPEVFSNFMRDHNQVALLIETLRNEEILEALQTNAIDVGFILDSERPGPDFEYEVLFDEEIVFFKQYGWHFEQQEPQTAVISKGRTGYNLLFHERVADHGLLIQKIIAIESIEGIKNFVRHGLGFGFLPKSTLGQALENQTLQVFNLGEPVIQQGMVVHHKQKFKSPILRAFLERICHELQRG